MLKMIWIVPVSHVTEVLKLALESELKPLDGNDLDLSTSDTAGLTTSASGDVTH